MRGGDLMKHFKAATKLIILLIALTSYTFGKCETETCGLVVRGTITDIQIERSKQDYISFEIGLAMEFKNESSRPIILFKPNTNNSYFDDRYYLGAQSLFEIETEKIVHIDGGAWESVMGSPFYKQLADKLDTKTPLPEFTKILQPDEVWSFADKSQLGFAVKEDKWGMDRRKTWGEMQQISSTLWLQVHYELSPWNVEFFKPNLLRKLAKRWRNYGNVAIEPKKDGSFNHFMISSQPMIIDFSLAKEMKAHMEQ